MEEFHGASFAIPMGLSDIAKDWIADFDTKIHHLIFQYSTEFGVTGRPGAKPSVQDVENKWNWTHRGRKTDPNPLSVMAPSVSNAASYHRFAIEYDETPVETTGEDQEDAEPVLKLKTDVFVFDDEENLVLFKRNTRR